jgi:hypothetical protein
MRTWRYFFFCIEQVGMMPTTSAGEIKATDILAPECLEHGRDVT